MLSRRTRCAHHATLKIITYPIWRYPSTWYIVCLLLLYAIATMFQLYHGGEPTLLPTQGIFNLPYHIGIVWEELAFDDALSYIQSKEMDCSTVKCYSSYLDSYPCLQGHQPKPLTTCPISPLLVEEHGVWGDWLDRQLHREFRSCRSGRNPQGEHVHHQSCKVQSRDYSIIPYTGTKGFGLFDCCFYILATSNVILGQVTTCESAHSWWPYSNVSLETRPPASISHSVTLSWHWANTPCDADGNN